MQLCCIPLRDLRYLRENNHISVLNLVHKETPISLPLISLIYADKDKTTLTTRCCSLRYNAALLHSSAGSALSAGEYSHKSTQAIGKEETSMSPADLADCAEKYNCGKPYYFSALKFTIRPSRLSIAIL